MAEYVAFHLSHVSVVIHKNRLLCSVGGNLHLFVRKGRKDKIRIERSEAVSSETRMRGSGGLRNDQQAEGLLDRCRERVKVFSMA